jgi:hypothetical protein
MRVFELKPIGRPVLIKWALNAWENSLNSQTIANGFKARTRFKTKYLEDKEFDTLYITS